MVVVDLVTKTVELELKDVGDEAMSSLFGCKS